MLFIGRGGGFVCGEKGDATLGSLPSPSLSFCTYYSHGPMHSHTHTHALGYMYAFYRSTHWRQRPRLQIYTVAPSSSSSSFSTAPWFPQPRVSAGWGRYAASGSGKTNAASPPTGPSLPKEGEEEETCPRASWPPPRSPARPPCPTTTTPSLPPHHLLLLLSALPLRRCVGARPGTHLPPPPPPSPPALFRRRRRWRKGGGWVGQ